MYYGPRPTNQTPSSFACARMGGAEKIRMRSNNKRSRHRKPKVVTRVLNCTLRAGLRITQTTARRRRRHREETHAMGRPRMDLRKALAEAARMEDEETLRKLALRK